MSLFAIVGDFAVFFSLVFGLGLPWTSRGSGDALEKLTAGAMVGLGQIYVGAWCVYVTALPLVALHALPLVAAIGMWISRRSLRALLADRDVLVTLGRLALFAGWCVAWLALIRSYGGGEWTVDWYEHYARARFFLEHQPLTTRFVDAYSVTARPPLVNLIVGAFMNLRGLGFPHAQLFTTLFSALLLLPALMLCRHFRRDRRADPLVLVVLMFSPMIIQNATFTWTKLPCTFLILSSVAFYVRGMGDADHHRRALAVAAMALAVLAHYSAAPYAIALGVMHGVLLCTRGHPSKALREFAMQLALALAVLSTWLIWAVAEFGWSATFLDNTTATMDARLPAITRLGHRVHSLWVTLVPHPVRAADYHYIAQTSTAGFVRDYAFNIYQTTIVGGFGLAGLALAFSARRQNLGPVAPCAERRFWRWFAGIAFSLSVASISWSDRWGIAHVGLITLIVGGLVWLTAANADLQGARRWSVGLALAVDAAFGLVLHFYLQANAHLTGDDWKKFFKDQDFTYANAVAQNAWLKSVNHLTFLGDAAPPTMLVILLLAALALLALRPVFKHANRPAPVNGSHG